jgi:hypothetical protein
MNDDIQDQLVQAYLAYFKANEKWETRRSYRTYYETQRWLRIIRKLGKEKWKENYDYFQENVNSKSAKGKK